MERAYFSETVKWYLNSKFYSRNKKNLDIGGSRPVLYHPSSGKSWGCFLSRGAGELWAGLEIAKCDIGRNVGGSPSF